MTRKSTMSWEMLFQVSHDTTCYFCKVFVPANTRHECSGTQTGTP